MFLEITFLTFAAYFVFKLIFQKQRKGKAPPGPFQWPIFGNLIQVSLADAVFPHIAMRKLAEKYGDIMSIKFGVHDTIVVSSYEIIKDLLTKEEFSGRYAEFPFVESRSFHKILGVIFMSGKPWHELRRYTIRNLREFGFGKRNTTASIMDEEMQEFLANLKFKIDKNNGILNVQASTFSLALVNILWAMVAGFRFSHQDENLKHILKLNNAVIRSWKFDNISTPYPALAYMFPGLTGYNSQMQTFVELQDFMRELIYKVKKDFEDRNDDDPKTFLECFLKEMKMQPGKSSDGDDSIFTEQQLIVLLKDLFLAGSETTSNSLTFGLLYMVLNPEIQKKVQDEIDAVSGDDPEAIPKTTLLPKMPYTEATLLEILRMSVVVPLPIPRKAMEDYVYKGYLIPKGSALFFNLSAVTMSKKYWGDPEIFRPERFLDSDGTKIINSEKVIPFGLGKRVCFGESLARDTMFTFFTTLLKKYTFKIPVGQKPPTTDPQISFTMCPKPFDVHMIPRN